MYDITLFKNTNFGNNDRVWNIPGTSHNFLQYTQKTFRNVIKRIPLLATSFILSAEFTDDLKEYDYLLINGGGESRWYFVDSISGDRNIIMISVILDVITTFNVLSTPITGTLTRKHDINENESPFDYPTALVYTPAYERYRSDVVSYYSSINTPTRDFIESSVDLVSIPSATTIESNTMNQVTFPILKKPQHTTIYKISLDSSLDEITDRSGALTLYTSTQVLQENLDTLRGLAGDGAITDSFSLPSNSVSTESANGQITEIKGLPLQKSTDLEYKTSGYIPKNKAIEGMFRVEFSSIASGDSKVFPSWSLKNSLSIQNRLMIKLWNDPKPSGNPYCCPMKPPTSIPIKPGADFIAMESTFEVMIKTSVKGEQWLRNPLVYNTGRGEILATVETNLQREKANFEKNSALVNLEISQREKDIRIAQQKYNYESSQTMGILGAVGDLASGNIGGAVSGASSAIMNKVNQQYINELQSLKQFEGSKQAQLIKIAHTNNLRSLDIQENVRRVVAPEIIYQENSSLKGYNFGNDFRVSIIEPDIETLKMKDLEYSLYGYPVTEYVENFIIPFNLRQNHSVFMFSDVIIELGGDVGDIAREFLKSGIRVLSSRYSMSNLLNNPKL